MTQQETNNVGVKIAAGLGLLILGQIITTSTDADNPIFILGFLMMLVGLPVFLWGCGLLAKFKGYSPIVGVLLGMLHIIGAIILGLLPDKRKAASVTQTR